MAEGPILSISGVLVLVDRHCDVLIASFGSQECVVDGIEDTTSVTSLATDNPPASKF